MLTPPMENVPEVEAQKVPQAVALRRSQRERMDNVPYASVVGSLMYAQVCTRPDLAFATGIFSRYQ